MNASAEFANRLRQQATERGHPEVDVIVRDVPIAEADALYKSLKQQYPGWIGGERQAGLADSNCLVGLVVPRTSFRESR